MSEADLKAPLLIAASKAGARLWRQNVGKAWVGVVAYYKGSAQVTLNNPRVFHAGLCKGSSDFIGWTPVVVTPEMVGQRLAVFTAIETKGAGKATIEQQRFIAAVNGAGGIAGVARTVDEALTLLKKKPGRVASTPG